MSPYDTLPPRAFWRSGVVAEVPESAEPIQVAEPLQAIQGLYLPKFAITKDTTIMTAGSCFAQHVHRNLYERDWAVLDFESPQHNFRRDVMTRFGYGMYSARYGNIYSARQMVQLLHEAYGFETPHAPVWQRPDGKYVDAQRPAIEPDGYDTPELVRDARAHHLRILRKTFESAELLIFTLGLTETWCHTATGTVYPTAPGVIATPTEPQEISYRNDGHRAIMADLRALNDFGKSRNPNFKLLLTVSPVPLTATASGAHVLPATTYSKSVLRAAAGEFVRAHDTVDYFPSFEIITNAATRGRFFEANQRSVTSRGVKAAMDMFFQAHGEEVDTHQPRISASLTGGMADEGDNAVQCEEVLLDAMNRSLT
ncbi:GSCFA domain-containing protein [Pacificibacter marinus]|uniref:GSCFA domain-containing protein n=1 Tax=Pacificibacter marinus TaxID=658057 RepID=UPI001C06F601|nr:GSCFA domain-containing protein [Pacificibacter marinus]MBU2865565.1 GSCFA domain-containing protein [Pacificibacter marinus]